jgi:hypothetical protein
VASEARHRFQKAFIIDPLVLFLDFETAAQQI